MAASERMKGNLYILAAALLWSTGGLLCKFIPWNGIVINGLRSIPAFFFFAAMRKSFKMKLNKTVVLAAVCLVGVTTLYVMANKLTTAGNAITLQYLSPVFVLIMQCIKDRRLPTKKQALVVLVTLCGMILLFFDQISPGYLIGNLLAIGAGISFAGVFFLNAQPQGSSEDANMLGFLLSFVVSIPFLWIFTPQPDVTSVTALLVLGILQVGLAYYLFSLGIRRTDPVSSSLISMIEVVANPLWVFLVLKEKPGRFALVGSILIVCAICFHVVSESKETQNE